MLQTSFLAFFSILLSLPAHAKFTAETFKIPCHKLKVKVNSCEPMVIKSSDYKNTQKKELSYQGAVLEAQIESDEAIQCSPKQEMDQSRFRPFPKGVRKLFVVQGSCLKLKKDSVHQLKNRNFFCDTPGAMGIEECLFSTASRKNRWLIVYEVN